MAEKNRVRTTGVQIFRANMLLRRRFAFRTPETYAYDLPSDYDARKRQIPLFDKPKTKGAKMKNNEIPRTMVQFLSIITGRQPHVVIGGPMAEPVAVTRLVAQGLFRTAAKRGYETRIVFDDQDRAAILHVQDIRQ